MDDKWDERGSARPDRREYVAHNYDPYNAAVDASLDQHRALAGLMKSQSALNGSRIFLYVAGGFSILALAFAVIVWLLGTPLPENFTSAAESGELGELARSEGTYDFEISTSFTVFNTTPTAAGEIVVTAKAYDPENLSTPSNQYCYVTTSGDVEGAETQIAFVSKGKVVLATNDEYLVQEAVPLCQFADPGR